ncbi:MAG: IS110 family transposase [Arenimonas sp.]
MRSVMGIDVSKAKIDVLWLKEVASLKVKSKVFSNDHKGHAELLAWLSKQVNRPLNEIHVVMEATGIYHEALAHCLFDHQVNVSVINPAYARDFARGLGAVHKTDKADSLILARYGAMVKPALWQPEPQAIRELKALLARIEALEADLQREKNRLEKSECNATSSVVIASLHKMIGELEAERQRMEKQIDDHIDRHPDLKNDLRLLRTIPGIGVVVSRVMLSVIRSRAFSTASECAAFLGVIPKLKESGIFRVRTTLSKKGPPQVRAKLYMAAIVASQYNPSIKAQRARLMMKGKNKMQALGAAMRKLVHQCFGVLKHQTEYRQQVI